MNSHKSYADLNVIDNYLFNELAMQPDKVRDRFFQILLETILDKKIRVLKVEPQKIIQGIAPNGHSIQLDAYIEAVSDEDAIDVELYPDVYSLEPNTYKLDNELKRFRYYHSLMDAKVTESGAPYDQLKSVTLIVIANYDAFGQDSMIYTFANRCIEYPDLNLDNGQHTIFLNSKGKHNRSSEKLRDMLRYMEESSSANAVNAELQELNHMVATLKQNSERSARYMMQWEIEQCIHKEGVQQGIELGREQGLKLGREQGIEQGREQGLRALISTCMDFAPSPEELHALVVKNPEYANVTLEHVKQIVAEL